MTYSASYQLALNMAEAAREPFAVTTNGAEHLFAQKTFIDLFAGAGGLSLGLMASGWTGFFAVEKNATAFDTLKHNLIEGNHDFRYKWPEWLPRNPAEKPCCDEMRRRLTSGLGQV